MGVTNGHDSKCVYKNDTSFAHIMSVDGFGEYGRSDTIKAVQANYKKSNESSTTL